jgi:hypothetical protein
VAKSSIITTLDDTKFYMRSRCSMESGGVLEAEYIKIDKDNSTFVSKYI